MKLDHCLDYYSQQGLITSPGSYQDLLAQFPTEIAELCERINETILIDFIVNMGLVSVPAEHLNDIQLRKIADKLAKIVSRNGTDRPEAANYEKCLLGNCRDLSLMVCSVLRNQQVPARVRSGFATFFDQQKYFDHWLCEYWNQQEERWIKVDCWMSQIQYRQEILPPELSGGLLELDYNPYDVKEKHFITGGQAWVNCREHGDNPDLYGTYEEFLKGSWFIRDNMLRDLLCLNRLEPLPWDCWGLMGRENSQIESGELVVLDEIAGFLNQAVFTETTLAEQLARLHIKEAVLASLN